MDSHCAFTIKTELGAPIDASFSFQITTFVKVFHQPCRVLSAKLDFTFNFRRRRRTCTSQLQEKRKTAIMFEKSDNNSNPVLWEQIARFPVLGMYIASVEFMQNVPNLMRNADVENQQAG